MNLMLDTINVRKDGVHGRLFTESGEMIAVTLEHAYETGIEGYAPKIPAGTYRCVRGTHVIGAPGHEHAIVTFEITGVEGHSGLLFHCGNFNRQSKGCVLLGKEFADIGDDGTIDVTYSGDTFERFMKLQDGVDEFELRVVREPAH